MVPAVLLKCFSVSTFSNKLYSLRTQSHKSKFVNILKEILRKYVRNLLYRLIVEFIYYILFLVLSIDYQL